MKKWVLCNETLLPKIFILNGENTNGFVAFVKITRWMHNRSKKSEDPLQVIQWTRNAHELWELPKSNFIQWVLYYEGLIWMTSAGRGSTPATPKAQLGRSLVRWLWKMSSRTWWTPCMDAIQLNSTLLVTSNHPFIPWLVILCTCQFQKDECMHLFNYKTTFWSACG